MSEIEVTSYKTAAGVDLCTLVSAGLSSLMRNWTSETFTLSDSDAGDVLLVVRGRHVQHSDLQLHSYFRFPCTSGHVTFSSFRRRQPDGFVVELTSRVAAQKRRAADKRPELQLDADDVADFRFGAERRRQRRLEVLDRRSTWIGKSKRVGGRRRRPGRRG